MNPEKGAVTGSFKIYTFTFDGYKLDAQERDLTVNFYCEFPCKTCDPFDFEVCYSCFIGDTFQNWHDFDCYTTCPNGFTATGSNNCTACVEPCATCSETTSTCTSCSSGFMLYKDNKCIEEVFYPFPWLLIAIVWFVIILVSEISTKGVSKFKEAYIAMLSISEFGSWVTFIALCVHRQGFKPAAIIALAALGCSLCLNAAHAFLHVKKIVPQASAAYQKVLTKYRYNSVFVRLVSYTVSFKFSLLLLSFFYLRREYRGEYGKTQMWYFNLISLVFICLCVPLICTGCIYYLIDDTVFSYAGFAALETLVITLLLASLMVVDAISVFKCEKGDAPKKLKVYAAPAADLDYESEDEGQRIKKRMGKGFANEFGDYEDRKNTTNNSLLYDEMKDALAKINADKAELEK